MAGRPHDREAGQRVGRLRRKLMTALTSEFEREREESAARLAQTVAPYTRYVRSEQRRLDDGRGRVQGTLQTLRDLRAGEVP